MLLRASFVVAFAIRSCEDDGFNFERSDLVPGHDEQHRATQDALPHPLFPDHTADRPEE